MYNIESTTEIAAPMQTLHEAVTTERGLRAWFVTDARLEDGLLRLDFGQRGVTLRLDRVDESGMALTCVGERNNPEWRGTRLSIELTPTSGGKTRVHLAQSGFSSRDEGYERTVQGWAYFMKSLSSYVMTGAGTPFSSEPVERHAAEAS